jgi:hypothetical protein
MSGLAPLLAGREVPGVRRWRSGVRGPVVREVVEAAGWEFRLLDGAGITGRAEFLSVVGEAFDFPETYGRNFDALADLLRDLPAARSAGRPQPRGTVVLWEAWSGFARADERWFDVAVEVFAERCAAEGLPPFAVLLRGPGPEREDLPVLD